MSANGTSTRQNLRLELVKALPKLLSDASNDGVIEDALEDLAKIEDYILGETE